MSIELSNELKISIAVTIAAITAGLATVPVMNKISKGNWFSSYAPKKVVEIVGTVKGEKDRDALRTKLGAVSEVKHSAVVKELDELKQTHSSEREVLKRAFEAANDMTKVKGELAQAKDKMTKDSEAHKAEIEGLRQKNAELTSKLERALQVKRINVENLSDLTQALAPTTAKVASTPAAPIVDAGSPGAPADKTPGASTPNSSIKSGNGSGDATGQSA